MNSSFIIELQKMREKRVKNKGRIYIAFRENIKKIWKDPVMGNVIAMVIFALLTWLFCRS